MADKENTKTYKFEKYAAPEVIEFNLLDAFGGPCSPTGSGDVACSLGNNATKPCSNGNTAGTTCSAGDGN